MKLPKLNAIVSVGLPILLTLGITIFLQTKIISDPEGIKNWLNSFGNLTIFAYIVLQTITIVFAPLGGWPIVIAAFAIFGPIKGSLLVYLVSTPAYIINFLLAKNYGRGLVRKLVGQSSLSKIDKYTNKLDSDLLILLKLLFGAYFDYISYATGFSKKIKLKQFIFINFLAGIPLLIIDIVVLSVFPNFASAILFLWILPVFTGIIYLPFHKRFKKQVEILGSREH